jgi:hypothetical protein
MTSTLPKGTLGSVAALLAATLYQRHPDRNHKLWNIVSTERYIFHRKEERNQPRRKRFSRNITNQIQQKPQK